jgi:hypothetical protein
MNRSLVLCLSLISSAVQAQQLPLVGVWQVTYPAGSRNEDGVVTPIMGTGTLTVEARGDSLVATLVNDSSATPPTRPPIRMTGPARPGEAVFLSQSPAMLNINGEQRLALVAETWKLSASGDTLAGSLTRSLIGADAEPQQPLPVTGHRRKS